MPPPLPRPPHPIPDNEIITRQFKLLSRLIIILSRLPVKKVIVTTGRDNALKRHRDVNIIIQLFNTLSRLTFATIWTSRLIKLIATPRAIA